MRQDAEAKFKAGDVVRMKSGSPRMTVNGPAKAQPHDFALVWFVDAEIKRADLPGELLELDRPDHPNNYNSTTTPRAS